ncbi:MAG: response regulator [Pseudomonadota bacterium]
MRQAVIIDDMDADRFFLRRQIRKAFPDCDIKEFAYATEAMSYLKTPARDTIDVIFVDINMPRMDGFAFADAFDSLYAEIKGSTRLFIVSSSINPDDEEVADTHPAIAGFILKPTSAEVLKDIAAQV